MNKTDTMPGTADSGSDTLTSHIGHEPVPVDHAETLRLAVEGLRQVLPQEGAATAD